MVCWRRPKFDPPGSIFTRDAKPAAYVQPPVQDISSGHAWAGSREKVLPLIGASIHSACNVIPRGRHAPAGEHFHVRDVCLIFEGQSSPCIPN